MEQIFDTGDFLRPGYSVILCNGQFPQHEIPLRVLQEADRIVCCDGAAEKLLKHGMQPHAIVGDMDSITDSLKHRYRDRFFHDIDQETNDLTKAVNWCSHRDLRPLVILGATGLREDHTLGNIALLFDYVEFIPVIMISDTGLFVPVTRSTMFRCREGQQVSIFSFSPQTEITSSGLKYDVSGRCFTNWNQGTLNESLANSFLIEFYTGKLIVYLEL